MVNPKVFHKISYGLYIVCSGNRQKGNGFISNTVFQVTSEPVRFAVCCNKDNYTAGLIKESGAFSVTVLHRDASPSIIGLFGFKSGRETDKLSGIKVRYGNTGAPVVLEDCIAWLEFRVEQVVDAGTHLLFIGILSEAEIVDDSKDPLTYEYYRQVKKGLAPKNAPTYINPSLYSDIPVSGGQKKFRCPACGYVYDEGKEAKKFSDLPADWVCPVCGCEKSEFIEI